MSSKNRNRLNICALDAKLGAEARRMALPGDLRSCPVAVVERRDDWGWLVQSNEGQWGFLTHTGKIQPLPQHKVRPAAEAAGVVLPDQAPEPVLDFMIRFSF